MDNPEVPKACGQVTPRDAGTIAVEHGIDKQAVVLGGYACLTMTSGEEILDAFPLGIGECIAFGHAR